MRSFALDGAECLHQREVLGISHGHQLHVRCS